MRAVVFSADAFKEYNEWFITDVAIIEKIKALVSAIEKDPFRGIGKPEPLKGNWAGYWSRRINIKHRLIYKVSQTQIIVVKCKGHY